MVRFLSLPFCLIGSIFATPEPIILYLFEGDSKQILDSSKIAPPVHLDIHDPGAVSHKPGALTLKRPTLIQSSSAPTKLIKAIQHSGEFSLSAWITPANLTQAGPARVISLSKDSSNRNFTLGLAFTFVFGMLTALVFALWPLAAAERRREQNKAGLALARGGPVLLEDGEVSVAGDVEVLRGRFGHG